MSDSLLEDGDFRKAALYMGLTATLIIPLATGAWLDYVLALLAGGILVMNRIHPGWGPYELE